MSINFDAIRSRENVGRAQKSDKSFCRFLKGSSTPFMSRIDATRGTIND